MSQMTPTAPDAKRGDTIRRAPGPRTLSPLGSATAMARDTQRFALKMWQRYGDIARFRFFFWPAYAVYHPDYLKHVLQDNHRNYDKRFPMIQTVRPLLGNGLFSSDGESWLHQRRLMQPSFHHKRLAGFGTIMTGSALDMLERWQEKGSQTLDIPAEMMRLAQRIAGLSLFKLDLSSEADTVGRAFNGLLPLLSRYTFLPFPPLWVPTPGNRRIQAGLATLNSVVYGIIADRRRQVAELGTDTGDLLSMLLFARDEETGEGMRDQQLRDEVMTLLLAGYETTFLALTWTWYLLSQHPEVEERLHTELETILGGRTPTVEDLNNLPYTRMVIQETMRLYPPVFGVTRHTIADDEIAGYHIPANSIIFLTMYCAHRHPEFWEEPERFDPERFTPERSAGRHRFAYAPFGGGPRQCIGNTFALMEAQLVLATVAQRYRLRLVPGHPVEPQLMFTLRPRYGLPMTLEPC